MIVFPNVKINIGLTVSDKRSDGYHNLESIFYPVMLCDILEIVKSDRFSLTVTGIVTEGNQEDNLVVKAFRLLEKDFALTPVQIILHKTVPTGSGLGAGSSDGAFALMVLNQIFELNLSEEQLCTYAEQLGSDCPFFIQNKPALVKGRGELIQNTNLDLSGYYIKIVHDGIHISTREAFAELDCRKAADFNDQDFSSLTSQNFNSLTNDFENFALKKYPVLSQIKKELQDQGAIYVSMSGSGSAFYGIFEKEPDKTSKTKFEFIGKL
ncbi:MAG: 4-(cytidine 5'-diphospho)-2-C-methyl-D-erythritol kinase [Crocinitomicaceae bacterium]|nr:4-(cytidine 5'-diphospho)-2-C-methyl-D-erythritol kinase [Crocinitomicaceae bacterium]